MIVNIHEAKTHLSKLLERVMNGEEIIIAKAGKPIAVLAPLKKPNTHTFLWWKRNPPHRETRTLKDGPQAI